MHTKKREWFKRENRCLVALWLMKVLTQKGNIFLPCIPPEGVPLPFLGTVRCLSDATDQVEIVGLLCVRPGLGFFCV